MSLIPYITIPDADDYFETRLNTEDWLYATDEEKYKSLCMATRIINSLNFSGTSLNINNNEFPRDDSTIVPQAILEATCEIALSLLDGTDMEQEVENLIATSQSYATVRSEYNPQLVLEHMRAGVPSVVAWNLLKPYLVNSRTISINRG